MPHNLIKNQRPQNKLFKILRINNRKKFDQKPKTHFIIPLKNQQINLNSNKNISNKVAWYSSKLYNMELCLKYPAIFITKV